jgi:hypothetical protein
MKEKLATFWNTNDVIKLFDYDRKKCSKMTTESLIEELKSEEHAELGMDYFRIATMLINLSST